MPDYVYILTNEAMPDLVKIGSTEREIRERMKELSRHESVPLPFACFYCCEVEEGSGKEIEKRLHYSFGDHRINSRREFFRIDPSKVKAILEALEERDVTPDEDIVEYPEEKMALDRERKKKPPFRFLSWGIPRGSKIVFTEDKSIVATVIGDREIEFEGERTLVSPLAQKILHERFGKSDSPCQGTLYWKYEDETLNERRLRMEQEGNMDVDTADATRARE